MEQMSQGGAPGIDGGTDGVFVVVVGDGADGSRAEIEIYPR